MHDEQANGALASRFFVFICPAAVVGHRLAAEIAFARFKIRVVDEGDGNFSLQVDAIKIVPLSLRRVDALADKYQGCVLDIDLG